MSFSLVPLPDVHICLHYLYSTHEAMVYARAHVYFMFYYVNTKKDSATNLPFSDRPWAGMQISSFSLCNFKMPSPHTAGPL